MSLLHRFALPFINAAMITVVLLYLMHTLIYTESAPLLPAQVLRNIEWTKVPEDSPVKPIAPKPEPPVLIDEAPDVPKPVISFKFTDPIGLPGEEYQPDRELIGPGDGVPEQLTLALGFPPVYPQGALMRGVEGFAVVGFSVSPAGEVIDAYIIESEPGSVFDRAALKAIKRFRYQARVVNGKPVTTDGQQYLFRFELEK